MSKSNKIITFVKDYALPQLKKYLKEEPLEEDNNANNELGGIEQLLELAQKQEKLLELYRKLMTVKDEMISIAYFNDLYYDIRLTEANLEKEIKELENET